MDILNTKEASQKIVEAGETVLPKDVAILIRQGKLPNAKKVNGRWQIPLEDVEAYIDKKNQKLNIHSWRITTTSIITLVTILTLISIAKDGLDLVKDYLVPLFGISSFQIDESEPIGIFSEVYDLQDEAVSELTDFPHSSTADNQHSTLHRDATSQYFGMQEIGKSPCASFKGVWNPYPEDGSLSIPEFMSDLICFDSVYWLTDSNNLALHNEFYSRLRTESYPEGNTLGAIHAPIPIRTTIEFSITITALNLSSIQFGIIPTENPGLTDAILLLFVELDESEYGYPALYRNNAIERFTPLYDAHQVYKAHVRFEIQDTQMAIFINDQLVEDSINITFVERSFWIGYSIKEPNHIAVDITDFTIIEN